MWTEEYLNKHLDSQSKEVQSGAKTNSHHSPKVDEQILEEIEDTALGVEGHLSRRSSEVCEVGLASKEDVMPKSHQDNFDLSMLLAALPKPSALKGTRSMAPLFQTHIHFAEEVTIIPQPAIESMKPSMETKHSHNSYTTPKLLARTAASDEDCKHIVRRLGQVQMAIRTRILVSAESTGMSRRGYCGRKNRRRESFFKSETCIVRF
jgi:hypothetical protein